MGNEASRDGIIASDTEDGRASIRRSTMKPSSGSMDLSSGGEVEYTANGRVRRKRGNNLMGQRLGSLDDYNFKTFPKSPLQKQLLLDALKGARVGYQHEAHPRTSEREALGRRRKGYLWLYTYIYR